MKLIVENIDVISILKSGSSFRIYEEEDNSITFIIKDRVINIKQIGDTLEINSSNNDNLEAIIQNYFDMNRDYNSINQKILKNNKDLTNIVNKCKKYRILNQDPFEMCISYIISQNNNVKRIAKSVNTLSERYGTKISFNNKNYYLFPTYDQLKNISIEELRSIGIGFRDRYVKDFLDNYDSLRNLDTLSTDEAIRKLMYVKGIGLKVASCILLFGYKRLDVFPIDTWVKQYMSDNFNIGNSQREIEKYSKENFGEYSGLIIQYMFHSQRNIK